MYLLNLFQVLPYKMVVREKEVVYVSSFLFKKGNKI